MNESIKRKENSIELLKRYNIPYIDDLPAIESSEDIKEKGTKEIARRAICTLLSIQVACDLNAGVDIAATKEFFENLLKTYGVSKQLTKKERAIFEGKVNGQAINAKIWEYERVWVLFWALGIIDRLDYPSTYCDNKFLIKTVSTTKSFDEFIKKCNLRNIDEILDQADLILRYDWACLDARINNRTMPCNLEPGVVYERHCALNWLIGADDCTDWDNIFANS